MIRQASPTGTCVQYTPALAGPSPVTSLSTSSVADHGRRRHSLFDKSATDGSRLVLYMATVLLEMDMASVQYGLV